MKGWRRIGIVLSVIWFVGFFGYAWSSAMDNAMNSASTLSCYRLYDASDAPFPDKKKYEACIAPIEARFMEQNEFLHSPRGVMLFVGIDLATILVGWLIAWGIIAVVRWVARGFAQA